MVKPEAIRLLAETAIDDVSHLLRTKHLEKLSQILKILKLRTTTAS